MNQPLAPVEIPDRPAFKPSEVCDLLGIPSYVLRTWENEFRDLGVARTAGAARTYRRQDVQLALRIKELVFTEHLTLAGVRRRLEQEHLLTPPPEEPAVEASGQAGVPAPMREKIGRVKHELRALLETLATDAQRAVAAGGEAPESAPVPLPPRTRARAERAARRADGANLGLPGIGDEQLPGPERPADTRLDPAALNFASVSVPPAAPGGRKQRPKS